MTSDEGEDPSRGENQIEDKQLKLSWQPKEKSSSGELQRQTKKEEEDIIFIHARTTEEPRRRFVFDSIQDKGVSNLLDRKSCYKRNDETNSGRSHKFRISIFIGTYFLKRCLLLG